VAVGTAVQRLPGIAPHSATLPVQAVVRDDDSLTLSGGGSAGFAASLAFGSGVERSIQRRASPAGCFVALLMFGLIMLGVVIALAVAVARR
jgi:hypothetical protein